LKKLNNKGYLLVEIIVAAVLAMGVAYFLINLTIRFSKTEEDIYKSITLTNDKNILTNMIMEDIEKYGISGIAKPTNNEVVFTFSVEDVESKTLRIDIGENNVTKITYGDDYSKQIDSSLIVGDVSVEENSLYVKLVIPMTSIYSDEDYGIKIFVPISNLTV